MLLLRRLGSLPLLSTPFSILLLVAAQVNHTIDDTNGDSVTGVKPTYNPSVAGIWAGPSCGSECVIHPDPSQAFDGTFSAATYKPQNNMTSISIEIPFTACNFTLDSQGAGSFLHTPNSGTQMEYNALVFSNINLPNSFHNLVISSSGSSQTFVNFDYAIYTVEDAVSVTPSASPNSSPPIHGFSSSNTSTVLPAAVGGAVGGVVVLLIVFFLLFRRHRRNKNRDKLAPMLPVPFDSSPTPLGSDQATGSQYPRYSNHILSSVLARPMVSGGKQPRQMQEDLPQSHPQPVPDLYEPPPRYVD